MERQIHFSGTGACPHAPELAGPVLMHGNTHQCRTVYLAAGCWVRDWQQYPFFAAAKAKKRYCREPDPAQGNSAGAPPKTMC